MDMDYRKDEVPLVMEDTKNDNVNHQQNDSPSIKHTALCEAPCVSMLRHIDSDSARMEPSTQSTIAHHAATPFAGSLSSTVSSSSVTANGCLSQTTSQSTSLTNSPPQQVCRGLKINVDSTAVPTNTDQQQDQDEMVHVSSKHVQDNNGDVAIPQSTPTPVFVDPTIALELNGDEVVRSNSAVSVSNVNATKTPNSDSPESVASSATPDALSQWTESPTESATTTPAAPTKKKSKSRNRYRPMRTLQDSLFGQVQLAYDTQRQCEVAVKVSHVELVTPKSQQGHTPPTQGIDAAATARSQAGVSVLEDVRREARILRMLLGSDKPPLTTATIDKLTCGLSQMLLNAVDLPTNNVVQPGTTNPLTVKQQFLDAIAKGEKSIACFYEEVEAESFHYLISEYVSGGDLFSVLTAQPQHKVSEGDQLCCSVRYMHAHSVAHLDLSLENICMGSDGRLRVIDFGLAAQHPRYTGDRHSRKSDGTPIRNASNHIKLLDEEPTSATCGCAACRSSKSQLLTSDPAIVACLRSGHQLSRLKYLCRPICERVHKPGKLGYMSCELYNNWCWDAYAQDMFGLGVILYSMLTGRPPFTRPHESDVWFKVIYSGQWLQPQVRSQAPASIYNHLSPNALHLINLLIKPQHLRPSIDVCLNHPFLKAGHLGNVIDRKAQLLNSKPQMHITTDDGRKIPLRRRSN